MCLNIKICECVVQNLTNMCDFHPLEVVGRGIKNMNNFLNYFEKNTSFNVKLTFLSVFVFYLFEWRIALHLFQVKVDFDQFLG